MNKTVKKFLLAGDNFMLALHLENQDLHIALVDRLRNNVKELKLLRKM